jgi:AcrR family transcriptional regulator
MHSDKKSSVATVKRADASSSELKKRGRPARKLGAENDQVKESLLDAARCCLSQKSYRNVTTREIAEQAGSNLGMIRYYFGGKDGLLAALIEQAAEAVGEFLALMDSFATVAPRERTCLLVSAFFELCQSSPWFVRLIIDDITNTDEKLRQLFNEGIGLQSRALLRRFIELQQRDGYYKADIDVDLTLVSIVSLLVMPFISSPMIEETYGVDVLGDGREPWIEHTVNLLERGLH